MEPSRTRFRRRWLPALAAAVAATTVATISAPAGAQPSPIQHVVVIYLENHSFDNLLGFWCRLHVSRCPDGGMPDTVALSSGAVVRPSVMADVIPVIGHQTASQAAAIDGGKMDGWQNMPGCGASTGWACISGVMPDQVPNLATLAGQFAISDDFFSMQDSPSWFGHLYAVAASTDGFTGYNPPDGPHPGLGWGCDSGKYAQWSATPGGPVHKEPSCVPDPSLTGPGGLPLANGGAAAPTPVPQVPTIMDRLAAANLTWRIYGANCTSEQVSAQGLDTCASSNGQTVWNICSSFAAYLYTAQCTGTATAQGDGLVPDSQFVTDASAGNLPAFSVVTAGDFVTSWHNGASITAGDNWLGQLVSAAMNGPQWPSTAVFITWDDCGCFYDQVPPGTNPDGTPQGPRVPLVIVSPYAKPGYTDTAPATFAGILAYTEQTFGLQPLGVNDAAAYPFTNAFDYSQAPQRPVRMVSRPVPRGDRIVQAQAQQDS